MFEKQLIRQSCYNNDGCSFVTSNTHILFKIFTKMFVHFATALGRKPQLRTFFSCIPLSWKLLVIWLQLSMLLKKVAWKNRLTNWMGFRSGNELKNFSFVHIFKCHGLVCTKLGENLDIVERTENLNRELKITERKPNVGKKSFKGN